MNEHAQDINYHAPFILWTVYDKTTKDFPGVYVARKFTLNGPTHHHMTSEDLDALREALTRMGFCQMARSPEDDPVIIESWI
jgi:hypothetical protein